MGVGLTVEMFETERAFGIEKEEGGIRTRGWIDAQGRVVRSESPVAFTVGRWVFEIAAVNFRRRDTVRLARASAAPGRGDVIPTTAVAAGAPLRPDTVGTVTVRLRGIDLTGLALSSPRQRLTRDTPILRRGPASALVARYRLPARDPPLRPFLAPDPLLQSAHP